MSARALRLKPVLSAAAILLLAACTPGPRAERAALPPALSGTFITALPRGPWERMQIELQFGRHTYPLPWLSLHLRPDATYVLGFCNRQIAEAGACLVRHDTVLLFHRFDVEHRKALPPACLYTDRPNRLLYLLNYDPSTDSAFPGDQVIPVEYISSPQMGRLRGQDLSLQAILTDYRILPADQQAAWNDSLLHSRQQD